MTWPAEPTVPEQAYHSAEAKVKILLVDDRPENLLALEAILSSLDQELVRATSGEAALRALLEEEFAVILLDVQMPGMDGFETAAHIKRRERTRDIPIIFLTAIHHEPHSAFRGYAVGAVDYLTKPFDPWVLRAKVGVFVELFRTNRRLQEQAQLLRRQLVAETGAGNGPDSGNGPGSGAAGDGLLRELSGRLSAVEEQARTVRQRVAEANDVTLANEVDRLDATVQRLRASLDALEPAAGDTPSP